MRDLGAATSPSRADAERGDWGGGRHLLTEPADSVVSTASPDITVEEEIHDGRDVIGWGELL